MENIFELNKKIIFNRQSAQSLLPLLYKITEDIASEAKTLVNAREAYPNKNSDPVKVIDLRLTEIYNRWSTKVEKLGAKPKGMWLIDFDNGKGYYCWKYPEMEILYHHGYQDGFSGRMIIDYENSNSPN